MGQISVIISRNPGSAISANQQPTNTKATVAADVSDRTVVKAMDKVIPVDWIGLSKVRDQITQDWRRKVIPLSR